MILSDTDAETARLLVERIQSTLESREFSGGTTRVQAVLGAAGIPDLAITHPSQLKDAVHAAWEQARTGKRGNVSV